MGMLDTRHAHHTECGMEVLALYRDAQRPESDGGEQITACEQVGITPAIFSWLAVSETTDVVEDVKHQLDRRDLTPTMVEALRRALNKPMRQRLGDWQANVEPHLCYVKTGKEKATLRVAARAARRDNSKR